MKIDTRILILSLAVGVVLILFDFFSSSAFSRFAQDNHEWLIRTFILVSFSGVGLLFSRQFYVIRQAEKRAARDSLFLQQLINAIPVPVFYKDNNYVYTGCNKSFAEYLGRPLAEIVGKTVHELTPKHLAEVYHAKDVELMENPGVQIYEAKVKAGTPEERNVILHKATYCDAKGDVGGLIGIILDITDLRKAEEQREKLITKLRQAIDEVRVLSGFLPICASCKKIRNDAGYWQQLEAYIREHSQAEFSHSICPDCAKKLFSEYDAEQRNQKKIPENNSGA